MIINHNIAALNTYRQLNTNSTNGQKALEKLSSGLRINKAGDDAAGLAISEKMRAQIRGLDQASRNAQDGISMVQTAEGALNETHSILQRMRELADQAANDTNVNVDREEIQKEINQLTSEINRIGNTTEFNTQKLLNGGGVDPTVSGASSKISANGLDVPIELKGGEGAKEQLAKATITFDTLQAADDGESFNITIGDRTLKVQFDNTKTNAESTTEEDTITIGISDTKTNTTIAGLVKNELNKVINADPSLKNNYSVSLTSAALTISADALSITADGILQGAGTTGKVSVTQNMDVMVGGGVKSTGSVNDSEAKAIVLTATNVGTDLNGVKVKFVDDGTAAADAVTASWDSDNNTVLVSADWSGVTATTTATNLTAKINDVLEDQGYGANALATMDLSSGATIANIVDASTITLGSGVDPTGNTGAIGTNATEEIDFTNVKVSDLVGSGIVLDGKTVDFYDSANGSYEGEADFAVDLNGARTSEQIVAKIVDAFSGAAADTVTASTATSKPTYGSDKSAFDSIFVTQSGSKLVVTAKTAGIAGNDIKIGNNATVNVTETYGSNKLEGEAVTSAKGLADGEHKVTINYVESTATVGQLGATQVAGDIASIDFTGSSTLDSGTYRMIYSAADTSVKIQKQAADGSWSDAEGTSVVATADAAQTLDFGNGLTITTGASFLKADYTDANDFTEFTIDAQHYEVTLTEAGSVDESTGLPLAGSSVRVSNGEGNVTLQAADGIGEAVVSIGTFDPEEFAVGDSISWSFETKTASQESSEVVGGTFTASFQIGANTGQSMTIEIKDMRSVALGVSGQEASGTVTAKNGKVASYVAVENVSNGTDNKNVEFALDVSDHTKASAAISVIQDAIESVSAQRSQLGAYQNRLEHTINNLGTSSENMTAAESRIRDVDMAKEMMEFTKNNILSQAAQAMLAQANQQPQGVLQLLR